MTDTSHLEIRKLLLKSDWVDGHVVSKCQLANDMGSMPAGTHFMVRRSFGGLYLKSIPCDTCGFAMYVTKVPERNVEYIGHLIEETTP